MFKHIGCVLDKKTRILLRSGLYDHLHTGSPRGKTVALFRGNQFY